MTDSDELAVRRAAKKLDSGEIHVSGVQLWDADTWILTLADNETSEITTLRGVPTEQALPFVKALSDYAEQVVSGVWWDDDGPDPSG